MKQDVLEPAVWLTYQGKDFTQYVEKHLICLTFVDVLEGESDSLDFELEDADRNWQGEWYPQHGDVVSAEIFYERGDLAGPRLHCGVFDIDEAELSGVPDVIQIKALGANVKRKLRSRQGKAYEETTLAAIAGEVAGRNGLELVGDIQDVEIARVTQANFATYRTLWLQQGIAKEGEVQVVKARCRKPTRQRTLNAPRRADPKAKPKIARRLVAIL